ncbi:T-complex protein 1 subunit zeta [Nematocida homosporus]|uniref:T-complex protein 1 subunit zeta n=1 Tax=Nematocida homosporus TaxID=1912981 RepID=UPI0022209C86|nr:T-complex protein 1 subunit zeta [Nematocida homosporus]KAI5186792.1 T-complex protein 1 subunit zeta [Nematocida homosporus]
MSFLGKETQITSSGQALALNTEAISQLAATIKNGFGPNGAVKLLITPAGEIRLVKDGLTLLKNIQLAQPGAVLLSNIVTQQGSDFGDGVTSTVILASAMLTKSLEYVYEGIHPQTIIAGLIKKEAEILSSLAQMKIPITENQETLSQLLLTTLRSKFSATQAQSFAEILISAVKTVTNQDNSVDLKMLEVMKMVNIDSIEPLRLIKGLVLDHGGRHPMMPKKLQNVFILCTNLSFEYETTEIKSQFYYKNTREKMAMEVEERKGLMLRIQKVIETMQSLAMENQSQNPQFMLITQKGIDQYALEVFAKYNVLALRRAKKRNMERLQRLTGCKPVNSLADLTKDAFGFAGSVREITIGEDKYTFIEKTPFSNTCTLLIQGISPYQMEYLEAAVKSSLQAVAKGIADQGSLPGGASIFSKLAGQLKHDASLDDQIATSIWQEALLTLPKTLTKNLGYNALQTQAQISSSQHAHPTISTSNGEIVDALESSLLDNYSATANLIQAALMAATKVLMVDEIIKGGKEVK